WTRGRVPANVMIRPRLIRSEKEWCRAPSRVAAPSLESLRGCAYHTGIESALKNIPAFAAFSPHQNGLRHARAEISVPACHRDELSSRATPRGQCLPHRRRQRVLAYRHRISGDG